MAYFIKVVRMTVVAALLTMTLTGCKNGKSARSMEQIKADIIKSSYDDIEYNEPESDTVKVVYDLSANDFYANLEKPYESIGEDYDKNDSLISLRNTYLHQILREGFERYNIPTQYENSLGFYPIAFHFSDLPGAYVIKKDTLSFNHLNDTIICYNLEILEGESMGEINSLIASRSSVAYFDSPMPAEYNRYATIGIYDTIHQSDANYSPYRLTASQLKNKGLFKLMKNWNPIALKLILNFLESCPFLTPKIWFFGIPGYYTVMRAIIKDGKVIEIDTISNIQNKRIYPSVEKLNKWFFYGPEEGDDYHPRLIDSF